MDLDKSSNQDYHSNRTHVSSSQLKLLLTNRREYHERYVLNLPQPDKDFYSEGSYLHALVLEPHTIDGNYAIYQGMVKRGETWEKFKKENEGKTIISRFQKAKAESWAKSVFEHKEAAKLLSGGEAELTMTGKLLGLDAKIRADYINKNSNYIVDVKTTAHLSGTEQFKDTVSKYMYDLSAVMYCLVASIDDIPYDFYFVVVSKADLQCHVYKLGKASQTTGMTKLLRAVSLYNKCKASGLWLEEKEEQPYTIEEV